jgi:transcriptional regulator with XRE-family HTH domain
MEREKTDKFYQKLGTLVATARQNKQVTQAQLANAIGKTRASVVNMEKGRQRPPLHLIWAIADYLEIHPLTLLAPLAYSHKKEQETAYLKQIQRQVKDSQKHQDAMTDFLNSL